jgi:hypothetical protein
MPALPKVFWARGPCAPRFTTLQRATRPFPMMCKLFHRRERLRRSQALGLKVG